MITKKNGRFATELFIFDRVLIFAHVVEGKGVKGG